MKDSYLNRLTMFKTCLRTLNSQAYQPLWLDQPPAIFTKKVQRATQTVATMAEMAGQQEGATKGAPATRNGKKAS